MNSRIAAILFTAIEILGVAGLLVVGASEAWCQIQFEARIDLITPRGQIGEVLAHDFDQSGAVDLLYLDGRYREDPRMWFIRNRGGGMFDGATSMPSVEGVTSGTLADVNGDGRRDVIASGGEQHDEVVVFLATVLPKWLGDPVRSVVGLYDGRAVPVDLNEDGLLDVLISRSNTQDQFSICLGDGMGSFSVVGDYSILNPSDLVSSDFDQDSHLDVAMISLPGQELHVLRGLGDGTLGTPIMYPLSHFERALVAADVDADTWVDLVTCNGEIVFHINDGAGGFLSGPTFPTGVTTVFELQTADFNGDGNTDFACLGTDPGPNGGVSAISLILSDGAGSFSPAAGGLVARQTSSFSIADIDADGALDIAIGGATGPDIPVLMGDGTGLVGPFAQRIRVAEDIYHLSAAADFDGDDLPDVIGATNPPGAFLFRGTPDGSLVLDSALTETLLVRDMAVADFNGDRNLDVALAEDALTLFFGDGAGGFVQGPSFPQPGPITAMSHGDIDEDGFLDVVMTSVAFNETRIYLADGAGSFLEPIRLPGTKAAQIIAKDVDGDGHLDLALGGSGTQRVLFGNGTGAFPVSVDVPNGTGATTDMTVSDFDGDGRIDVAFLGEEGTGPGARGRISIVCCVGKSFPVSGSPQE